MRLKLFIIVILLGSLIYADGLLMPENESYPKDFLRNRMTKIDLDVHGLVVEAKIYQEFVNESTEETDAVFSYPLPDEAKATRFLYWYEDKIYEAVLKVKEQAQNPGHGDDILTARVDEYIGRNGIKIRLKGIKAGAIQRTELRYIAKMDYSNGNCSHEIPLNTEKFVKYPYENFEMNVTLDSNSPIKKFSIPDFENYRVIKSGTNELRLELSESKFYPNRDITFQYSVRQEQLGVDFYSSNNDTTRGHFGLFVKPELNPSSDSLLAKRIIFLLSNSHSMSGVKLEESIASIKAMLGKLKPTDKFNIISFNYRSDEWKTSPVEADSVNIKNAKNWLNNVDTESGSDMNLGLMQALNDISDNDFNNIIVVFTGSYSYVDPLELSENNKYKTGIFPVGFGSDLSFAQLEMTAAENYGFVTYIDEDDNIKTKIDQLLNKISRPVLKDISMEYGGITLSETMPKNIPSYYAGSYFFTTGRYDSPGNAPLSIGGETPNGYKAYDFRLDFTEKNDTCTFIDKFWAKSKIDRLEWETELYGETQERKQELIDLSLDYNIRCIYTGFLADYEKEYTSTENRTTLPSPKSFITKNYPNPFNPTTNFKIYIENGLRSGVKLIKIYDILGRLVAVIDISQLQPGWNKVFFNGRDNNGKRLPSGTYIVTLQIGNRVMNSVKINLVK